MTTTNLSSSDLTADRRAGYARMYAEAGDFAAAAELMRQALDLAPSWAAGWFTLGLYEEKGGRLDLAADAFRAVLRLEPRDLYGAELKLAALGLAAMPDTQPRAYVERLFDDYAGRFDRALVETLRYSIPEKLTAMLSGHGDRHFATAIDLGCGTGLMGERLRGRASFLKGYDLSRGMLAKAAEKGIYDVLAQADLSLGFAEGGLPRPACDAERADLVTAADVFMYLGDLGSLFASAAALTAPGGLFAFSVEAGDGSVPFRLQPSLRFAHGADYLAALCDAHGFEILDRRLTDIRMDGDAPVRGILFLTRRREDGRSVVAEPAMAEPAEGIIRVLDA